MARTSIFQAIRSRDEVQQPAPVDETSIPAFRSNYEDKLRLIGMHLDHHDHLRAKILEVPGGMLVRATGSDKVSEELLEFPDQTFEDQFGEALDQRGNSRTDFFRIKTDLIPTSYSDVLRAIGAQLDEWMARSILISEGSTGIYISGLRLQETSVQSRYAPFEEILTPESVDALLTESYARRDSQG